MSSVGAGEPVGCGLDFRILGPFDVLRNDVPVALSGTRKALLAALLLRANETVSSDRLIEDVWGEEAPATALKMVRNAVWALRRLLDEDTLVTRPGGYELRVAPQRVDSARFEQLARAGRDALAADTPGDAAEHLRAGLGLWRGRALADFAYSPFAHAEIARLEELRLNALEDRIEAELELGGHGDLVGELEALVSEQPLRERLRGQLMLALYRSGRQAEALAAYQQARKLLVDELGLEPSPALRRLEQSILRHDPALEPARAAAAPPPPVPSAPLPETRRMVAAVFVVFTPQAADAEARRRLLAEAAAEASAVLTRHGAVVDRLPSGTLMGIFGVPAAHEDDPLRALRATAELRAAGIAGVELAVGLDAGEAIVEAAEGDRPVVEGEVVTRADRLAQEAEPGEVLVGEDAERLLRGTARLERRGGSWRLVELVAGAPAIERHFETPLVGRERERELLRARFERCVEERAAHLFTVLGAPGIGKSKLVREFAASVEGDARVLEGHCPAYGDGVAFWPLREIVRAAIGDDDVEAGIARVLSGDPDAVAVAQRVAAAIGAVDPAGSSREETFRAVRRLLEALAQGRPLVLVLEDMHWAEPTFLELVDHVVDLARAAPILVLCVSRAELLERRPLWAGGRLHVASILLEPLGEREAERLIDNLASGRTLDASARARIVGAAEGNALFLEQILALIADEEEGAETAVPPSLQALLASRLERLPAPERLLLERAAVAGRSFSRETVDELAPEDEREGTAALLEALAHRELIRPERPGPGGEDVFRFVHGLVREAVYESVPKRTRAVIHERFAERLERRSGSELDELVGHHLDQAHRYRCELGLVDERTASLAARAVERLTSAGRKAYARDDVPTAARLLERAAALVESGDPRRAELLAELGDALRETGEFRRADTVLAEAVRLAADQDDKELDAYARVCRLRLGLLVNPRFDAEELIREAVEAVGIFERAGNERRLAKAWELLAWAPWFQGQAAAAEAAAERAATHARRARDARAEAQSVNLSIGTAVFGPLPVEAGIRRCEEILAGPLQQRRIAASATRALGALTAMQGAFDVAREYVGDARQTLEDLGLRLTAASAAETAGMVELLAGDFEAAEHELRQGYEQLGRMGVTSTRANLAALLAQALLAQGRDREALLLSEVAEQSSSADDLSAQVHWQAARARALAGLGRHEEAERFGRRAVELAEATDFLNVRGDALLALADADPGRAREWVGRAADLYDQKGNVVSAAAARARLTLLRQASYGLSPGR